MCIWFGKRMRNGSTLMMKKAFENVYGEISILKTHFIRRNARTEKFLYSEISCGKFSLPVNFFTATYGKISSR